MLRRGAIRRHCLAFEWYRHRVWRGISAQVPASLDFQALQASGFIDKVDSKLLWSQVEKAHSTNQVIDVVKKWQESSDNQLSKPLMNSIFYNLCTRAWYEKAEKLAKWVDSEKIFDLDEDDQVLRLEILCRRGNNLAKARRMFDGLANKTETAYNILLNAFTKELKAKAAEEILKELKESNLMTSARAYTWMIKMYIRLEQDDKALEKYKEFEASGLPEDAAMYWFLLSHKDTVFSSVPVTEKVAEVLEKLEPDEQNRRDLVKLQALLGNTEAVDKLWSEIKGRPPVSTVDYLAAISCYDLVGAVDKAEEVSKELESSMDGTWTYKHSLFMLRMYSRHGDMEKAEALMEKLVQQKVHYEQCHPLVDGYLKLGKFEDAVDCFTRYMEREGHVRVPFKLVAESMVKLNQEFAKRGDVKGAEKLLAKVPKMAQVNVYNSLLKVYQSAKMPCFGFQARMAAAKVPINDETKALLAEVESL